MLGETTNMQDDVLAVEASGPIRTVLPVLRAQERGGAVSNNEPW